jgi:hypothetical protein
MKWTYINGGFFLLYFLDHVSTVDNLLTAEGWKGTQEISQSKEDLSCNPEIYQVITIKLHKPLEE